MATLFPLAVRDGAGGPSATLTIEESVEAGAIKFFSLSTGFRRKNEK
ncbi:hypothetical protein [Pigmentiphaga humi]|nr:hypothetical protein [Pigmentiphaga humi]